MEKEKDAALVWPEDKEKDLVAVSTDIEKVNKLINAMSANAMAPAKQTDANGEFVVIKFIPAGNRFDPRTGKQVVFPTEQMFSRTEWNMFKTCHKALGYTITEVVSDPFGEAEQYVESID